MMMHSKNLDSTRLLIYNPVLAATRARGLMAPISTTLRIFHSYRACLLPTVVESMYLFRLSPEKHILTHMCFVLPKVLPEN